MLLFGVNQNASEAIRQYSITRYDTRILGSYVGNYTFPQAIRILENKLIEAQKLITHELPLVKLLEGIELMRRGEGIKIVIEPWKIE